MPRSASSQEGAAGPADRADGSVFQNRAEAGVALAGKLGSLALRDPIVVALPRGGVPVAREVARALDVPLDVLVARKLGAPGQPEFGIGAIAEDGPVILDDEAIHLLGVTAAQIDRILERERKEMKRRRDLYRGDRPALEVRGRTVLLVDDGLATGVTAVAAARALRSRGAARVVVAVPVCPAGSRTRFADEFDDLISVKSPQRFGGVGYWYRNFAPCSDREVIRALHGSDEAPGPQVDGAAEDITIRTTDGALLKARLNSPGEPEGVILFAHGSGSSRLSPRNVAVARYLEKQGYATLLFDLLAADEDHDRDKVFDIEMLANRLVDVTIWLRHQPGLVSQKVGYFGASTGAAAAIKAAVILGRSVSAVVSRGGRPDLAGSALTHLEAPTLLIVGGADPRVLKVNEYASEQLSGEHELVQVPGAGHTFEEPGTLDEVARLAGRWFDRYLKAGGRTSAREIVRAYGRAPESHPTAPP